MSRSTQFIGFPTLPDDIFYGLFEKESGEVITGMFREEVIRCNEYSDEDGNVVLKETLQCDPWASGPCIFMKIVDGNGNDVYSWSEEEIANII